jgi:hypothetical protein
MIKCKDKWKMRVTENEREVGISGGSNQIFVTKILIYCNMGPDI